MLITTLGRIAVAQTGVYGNYASLAEYMGHSDGGATNRLDELLEYLGHSYGVRTMGSVDGDEMVTGSDTGEEEDGEAETGTRRSAQGHGHAARRRRLHLDRIEKKNQEEEE